MSLEAYAARYLPPLEQELQRAVETLQGEPADYTLMMRYHMGWVDADGSPYEGPRGKRVRPLLLMLCAEAAGGDPLRALPAAAAIELIHNFSLIHDDIQDESSTRRGRPTVWKIWGRAQAINAGDAMYTLAYLAMHRLTKTGTPPVRTLRAWQRLAETCLALTHGQHMDLSFEARREVSMGEYLSMIGAKTAALIEASAEIGALVAGADAKVQRYYADFGRNIGLAFQLRDDILGIWGDEAVTGKPGDDILSRKKSLPVIYALSRSQALRELYALPELTTDHVARATALIEETDARTYAENHERRAHSAALTALMCAAPAPGPAEALNELTTRLLRRTS
jgi:geranylgeranyl diphosphate synthase type I